MVKILVIDTETTGLFHASGVNNKKIEYAIKNKNVEKTLENFNDNWLNECPHITQMCFIIYDTNTESVTHIYNKFIDIDINVKVHKIASKITHIYTTPQDVIDNGENPSDNQIIILSELKKNSPNKIEPVEIMIESFIYALEICECIIGHNVIFDIQVLLVEVKRINNMIYFKKIFEINHECTMLQSTNICNLMIGKRKKYPKLIEAYNILFKDEILYSELHNAFIDAYVCLKIYCKLNNWIQPPHYFNLIQTC
jgi:hypothetical protein